MELHGRAREQDAIGALIAGARAGRSGVLVLCGAAGLGKTALLDDAAARAGELPLLRATGVEAEATLPFAGLHQLLGPARDLVRGLPHPQAAALQHALGVAPGPPPEPLLLGAGLLGVLAEGAPALVLVDDLQWLDAASAAALGFAARRLHAEGVAVLAAARDASPLAGLPELRLAPLDRTAAAAVLAGAGLAPAVREQVLDAAAGNPLALAELPASLDPEARAGRTPLDGDLPVPARLAAVYRAQLATLTSAGSALLRLAAADAGDDPTAVLAAARGEVAVGGAGEVAVAGVVGAALEEVERAGLLAARGGRLVWRHPLVRATVREVAGEAAMREAHAALARVCGPDAAAWHRAAATVAPDEAVAAALAEAGMRAARLAAHAAAARALERAGELTPAGPKRPARYVAAARAAWTAGHAEHAEALLAVAGAQEGGDGGTGATPGTHTPEAALLRAEAGRIAGSIALHRGSPAAARRLLEAAARELAPYEPTAALRLGVAAMEAASLAGEAALPDVPVATASGSEGAFLADMVAGVRATFTGDAPAAVPRLRAVIAAGADLADAQLVVWAGAAAFFAGDEEAAVALHQRAAALAQAGGQAVVLPFALAFLATAHRWAGNLAMAEADAREALRLADEAGLANTEVQIQATLAEVLALRGDAEPARALATTARTAAAARGLVLAEGSATLALAELDLAAGDPGAAFERVDDLMHAPGAHPAHRTAPAPVLAEAAARAGRPADAREAAVRFAAWAETIGAAWAAPLAARSLALTGPEGEAEPGFATALRLHERHRRPLDRARTALLLGERLRRARRKAEARAPLRMALEDFERAGAVPWADRARDELRAAGAGVPSPRGRPLERLTPQQRQVASLVARGASNRDAAAALFLSPRTVEYHLHNVFRSLGVQGRTELAAVMAREQTG